MRDEPDPPRKTYQLKPRAFEAVNTPPPAASADATPIDVQGHFRSASAKPPARLDRPPIVAPKNDVQTLLRDSVAHSTAAGANELIPLPTRRSRRKRDYWLVLIPVDLFFAFFALGPFSSPSMRIYAFSGFVMFTVGLTWVMWFVMDDY